MEDLTQVVEEAAHDAEFGTTETEVETSTPETEVSADSTESTEPVVEDSTSSASSSPANRQAATTSEEDKFAKEFGLASQMASGRENRIPYSRVKAIVTKAQEKAVEPLTKQVQEYTAKVTEYEDRLKRVDQFEQVLTNDPERFLQFLATVPAYQPFFQAVQQLQAQGQGAPAPETQLVNDMPQPDQKLADGTLVYSMEGLKKLREWDAKQIEGRVISQVSERYQPIEEAWKAQEQLNRLIPQIQSQIDEARTWPQFKDNEPDIVKALDANPNLSLEGAYRQVVFPRIVKSQEEMRKSILQEVKKIPHGATSAPSQSLRAGTPQHTGPRDITDIIRGVAQTLPGYERE